MGTGTIQDPLVNRLRERIIRDMQVDALIWFGSRTTGRANGSSDYDFIVVSREFDGVRFLARSNKLGNLRDPDAAYDFLCYTPEEFEQMASEMTIVREAVETGIRLI